MGDDDLKYKVCILAAGVGRHTGGLSDCIHQAILPVNCKAVISYIVEKFPKTLEIVVAVGHKKETVRNYLLVAYPGRTFTFVDVDRYSGPGSGPGYSLLQCKKHLQLPFIVFAADTIVLEDVPAPDYNWLGIAPVKDVEQYCTVKIKNNLIYHLDVKVKNNNRFAFIGLAGVRDYEAFFAGLSSYNKIVQEEIQVTDGFEKLIVKGLTPIGFTWFDTGTVKKYQDTNKKFSHETQKFEFRSHDAFQYVVDDKVIVFVADEEVARKKYTRAVGPLSGLTPKAEKPRGQFYSYRKVEGHTLYDAATLRTVTRFLDWARTYLWQKVNLSAQEAQAFYGACRKVYFETTRERLDVYHRQSNAVQLSKEINDVAVPHVDALLTRVDWAQLTQGAPSNFHGNLHFENILVSLRPNSGAKNGFKLLDWRQDFGGLTSVGDLYYDLATLYGGIVLPYNLIKDGMFSFEEGGSSVYYGFFTKHNLVEAKEEFERFVTQNAYDLRKVKIITALNFLNMAALHAPHFNALVYHLGRQMLGTMFKAQEL